MANEYRVLTSTEKRKLKKILATVIDGWFGLDKVMDLTADCGYLSEELPIEELMADAALAVLDGQYAVQVYLSTNGHLK